VLSSLALLLIAWLYAPALTTTYGFLDDYSNLLLLNASGRDSIALAVSQGRFSLVVTYPISMAVHEIGDLVWWRFLGVLAAIGVFFVATWVISTATRLPRISMVVGLAIVSLPAVALFVTWASVWFFVVGIGLSFLSARAFFEYCLPIQRSRGARRRVALWIIALVLWVFCIGVYQPVGVIVPVVFAFLLTCRAASLREVIVNTLRFFVFTLATGVVYLLAYRGGVALVGTAVTSRAAAPELPAKAQFLVHEVLPRVLMPMEMALPSSEAALIVGMFLVLGVVLFRPEIPVRQRVANVLLLLLALIVSLVPLMVTAENWPSNRIRVASQIWFVLVALVAMIGFGTTIARATLHRRLTPHLITILVVAGSAFVVVHGFVLVRDYMVTPQAAEYEAARAVVRKFPNGQGPITVEQADWTNSLAPSVQLDEFGLPSSAAPWVPVPFVTLLWQETHDGPTPPISLVPRSDWRTQTRDHVDFLEILTRKKLSERPTVDRP